VSLTGRAAELWKEHVTCELASVDVPVVQAWCHIAARLESLRARLDEEGLVVSDAKGQPVPHPALAIERQAIADLARLQPVVSRIL
jgi:phage terminase small subunit